jgi:hypothetical protein
MSLAHAAPNIFCMKVGSALMTGTPYVLPTPQSIRGPFDLLPMPHICCSVCLGMYTYTNHDVNTNAFICFVVLRFVVNFPGDLLTFCIAWYILATPKSLASEVLVPGSLECTLVIRKNIIMGMKCNGYGYEQQTSDDNEWNVNANTGIKCSGYNKCRMINEW